MADHRLWPRASNNARRPDFNSEDIGENATGSSGSSSDRLRDQRDVQSLGAEDTGFEGITWSIHAQPDEGGEGSDSSGSDEDVVERTRRRRLRRLNGQQQQQQSDTAQGNEYDLRLAHAIAHNPVDALLPSPPRSPIRAVPTREQQRATAARIYPSRRVVTVNDIKNRTCWICSDGDGDEDVASRKSVVGRRWVHPCKCTLVAHEACLLQWIRSRRTTSQDANKVILCPQCSHPYGIIERKPILLRLFEHGDRMVRDALPIASAGVLGGSILIAASAYGCVAIRLWMGKDAAARILNRRWPWHYFVDIPLIPFALVLSRLRFFDRATMWLPTILAFPVFHVPVAAAVIAVSPDPRIARRNWNIQRRSQLLPIFSTRVWPPGPFLTILFVPWIRSVYLALKRRVTRKVLAPFARIGAPGALSAAAEAANAEEAAEQDVRLPRQRNAQARQEGRNNGMMRIIVGQDVPHEGEAADGETVGIDEHGNARELPPGAEAIDGDRNIYVSPQSLAKLCLGALSAPLVADIMGRALARLATQSYWMRRFLGIEDVFGRRFDLGATQHQPLQSSATPTMAPSSMAPSRSPLANIFYSGSTLPIDTVSNSDAMDITGRGDVFGDESDTVLSPFGQPHRPIRFDDLDPAWFRNTIGAGLFIVVKDAIQLGFRYMRLQHAREGARRTRIIDRPFEGSVIDGLDLREPL